MVRGSQNRCGFQMRFPCTVIRKYEVGVRRRMVMLIGMYTVSNIQELRLSSTQLSDDLVQDIPRVSDRWVFGGGW
jgi:hypothetical protein